MRKFNYRRRARGNEGAVILVMGLLLSLLLVGVLAAKPTGASDRPARAPARRGVDSSTRSAARPGAPPAARKATGPARPTTLEDITIQGEIDVPQVLFISGRPRPLYDDGSYRLFRPTPQRLLQEVALPSELFLMSVTAPHTGGKEAHR